MTDFKVDGGGLRLNSGKLPMELIPTSTMRAMAEVLAAGAKKYAPRNWERGMKWSICYACILRHLTAWFDGQDNDPETGLNHMKHVLTNAAFLIEYQQTCPELDDRPKKVKSKTILYIDMDEVLVDFLASPRISKEEKQQFNHPAIRQSGFFYELPPMAGALEAVRDILALDKFDVFIASQPVSDSPDSYSEKAAWVRRYLPELSDKLILTQNKLHLNGDILIDDNDKWSAFPGKFVKFNRGEFPAIEWERIYNLLKTY